jgi:hypothetical protein
MRNSRKSPAGAGAVDGRSSATCSLAESRRAAGILIEGPKGALLLEGYAGAGLGYRAVRAGRPEDSWKQRRTPSPPPEMAPEHAHPRVHSVMHWLVGLRGSPEAIARGLAIGLFVAFTPTIGVQLILAAALATLLGASRAAALVPVWITNPVTIPPIYGFTYMVGSWFFPGPPANRMAEVLSGLGARLRKLEILGHHRSGAGGDGAGARHFHPAVDRRRGGGLCVRADGLFSGGRGGAAVARVHAPAPTGLPAPPRHDQTGRLASVSRLRPRRRPRFLRAGRRIRNESGLRGRPSGADRDRAMRMKGRGPQK